MWCDTPCDNNQWPGYVREDIAWAERAELQRIIYLYVDPCDVRPDDEGVVEKAATETLAREDAER